MSDTFEREVLDRLIKIETKIESWDNSKKQIYDNQSNIIHLQEKVTKNQKDISDLRDRNKWLGRTTVGAVITAAASVIAAIVIAVI